LSPTTSSDNANVPSRGDGEGATTVNDEDDEEDLTDFIPKIPCSFGAAWRLQLAGTQLASVIAAAETCVPESPLEVAKKWRPLSAEDVDDVLKARTKVALQMAEKLTALIPLGCEDCFCSPTRCECCKAEVCNRHRDQHLEILHGWETCQEGRCGVAVENLSPQGGCPLHGKGNFICTMHDIFSNSGCVFSHL